MLEIICNLEDATKIAIKIVLLSYMTVVELFIPRKYSEKVTLDLSVSYRLLEGGTLHTLLSKSQNPPR
jgi:hypothetical protein